MRIRSLLFLPVAVTVLIGVALPCGAHIDTLAQVINPDPLVRTFEAEALSTTGVTRVLEDASATGGKAVVLAGEGAGFALDLGPLPVGMHALFVCGKVVEEGATVKGAVLSKHSLTGGGAVQRVPLYVHLRVNSAADGSVQEYRMRVPFLDEYEYMAKLYFHTPAARTYRAEVFVGPRSRVRELVVDRLEVRNPLGGLTFDAVKERRMLFSDDEIALLRVSTAKEGKLKGPLRPQPLPRDERDRRDAVLWNAVMPLNANPAQIYGTTFRGGPALTELMKAAAAKLGRDLGKWENAHGRNDRVDAPWKIVNKALGLEYTLEDYRAGRTLPAPWPISEDSGLYYFDSDEWGIEAPFNYGIVGRFIQERYHAVLDALGATPQGHSNLPDLPGRYLLTGDLEAAADAALLLAAYAYRYPGYDWNLHCLVNIIPVNRTFDPSNVYGRGCSYQGWSTGEVRGVLRAYDKLFPYIDGNARLAERIGRFVPWVRTPRDVVKLIDTFLVQRAARDGVQHVLYAPVTPTAAVVLGPNAVSEAYLDQYFTRIYLRDSLAGYIDQMIGGYSRDGLNYIGSTFYTSGESTAELLEGAIRLKQYVAAGGDRRFDISDTTRHPRLAAMVDSVLRLHIAGGLRPGAGDVMDPQMGPRLSFDPAKNGELFLHAYRWTRDPRFAWVLANMVGQGTASDREWTKIVAAAAGERDPVLHQESTVLEGFGLAMLNEGVDATDRRHKNAVSLRFGVGSGHAHADTLDLEVFAYGCRMTSDLGGRSSGKYGRPNCMKTYVHNLVEVDGKSFNSGTAQNATGLGWLTAFKPFAGAQYVQGAARAEGLPRVSRYSRGVLQVMCDAGDGADVKPAAYVFDVFRVAGGKVHTWCFHGCVSEAFTCNAGLTPATSELAAQYLVDHRRGTQLEGTAPDVLEASWTMRRREETVDEIALANAEKAMLKELYDESAAMKATTVSLFGHDADKVMVANWYAQNARRHSFPFLYVRSESNAELESVFPAIIEPSAGERVITGKRELKVANAGDGVGRAVALELTTRFGQRDMLFSSGTSDEVYEVEGGVTASGRLAFVSADASGVRLLHLVGGRELSAPGVAVQLERNAYSAAIKTVRYDRRIAALSAGLPPAVLDGEMLTISNPAHATVYRATLVNGRQITFARTSSTYLGGVEHVNAEEGYAVLDLPPFLYNYHTGFYEGMTAVNEAGAVLGRVGIRLGERFWYLGFPEARRHTNRMAPGDVADTDGDGSVTLAMIATMRSKKFADDGETVVWTEPGEKMLDLEVTRVREDGLMFWSRQHPRDYLDSINIPHPGWPYHRQIVRNEKGDREWVLNMPGDTYQLVIEGRKLTDTDFPDRDGDGRRTVTFHDYGPGDTVTAPTHCYVQRKGQGIYELRANTACAVALPGTRAMLSSDAGATWAPATATTRGKLVEVALTLKDLGPGVVLLKVE